MFFYVLLIILVILVIYLKKPNSPKHRLPPAYPGALPVIGHLHKVLGDSLYTLQFLKNVSADCIKQGGVTHLRIGSHIYYLITDPEDATTVANTCFNKPYLYDVLTSWLGNGLITRPGESWKPHRKIMNPAFTLPVVHNFLGLFNSQTKKLVKIIEPNAGKGPFSIWTPLGNILLETACLATFGQGIGDGKELQSYMDAVVDMLALVEAIFTNLWYHINILYKLLGYKKKEQDLVKYLQSISDKAIKNAKDRARNTDASTFVEFRSFVDIFLDLPGITSLTDEEFRNEADTVVAASFDTTWSATLYLLACIGTFTDVQEKMYQEIIEVIGEERDIEKEDLSKLVYTEAVIKESLRWLPPAHRVLRYIDKEVKLKNYTLRAGTQCVFMLYGLNRQTWADAEFFKPERWLDPAMSQTNVMASFSFGKRNCIGKPYAITSLKVTAAHLVRAYKVTADVTKMVNRLEVTVKPISGHEIKIEKRK